MNSVDPYGFINRQSREWASLIGQPRDGNLFYLSDFGARGDGKTDDTLSLSRAAKTITERGGGILRCGESKTYKIWPSGTGDTAMLFTGCEGVVIEGNGSTIMAGNVNGSNPYCFYFDGGAFIAINDLQFDSAYTTLDPDNGPTWIAFKNGTKHIQINRVKVAHGRRGIYCEGWGDGNGTDDFVGRVKSVVINGFGADTVYYPLLCAASGDDLHARGFVTLNCGRSYFIYNVENHDVQLDSAQGGEFSDCLIKGYGSSAAAHVQSSGCRNIKLRYSTLGKYSGSIDSAASEAFVNLECGMFVQDPGPVFHQDIHVDFNVNVLNATEQPYHAFVIRKVDEDGNLDDTASRGHTVKNISITGTIRNWDNAPAQPAVDIFSLAGSQNWTGEVAQNIVIENLSIPEGSAAVLVNGLPFATTAPGLTLRNIKAAGTFGENNIAVGTPITEENCFFSNLTVYDVRTTVYTPTWAGGSPSIGNGTLSGIYSRRGRFVEVVISLVAGSTTNFGSAAWTFSIPFAAHSFSFAGAGAYALDSGTAFRHGVVRLATSTTIDIVDDGGTVPWQATVPHTWATNDQVILSMTYLAAA